jgi:hypothetical protein
MGDTMQNSPDWFDAWWEQNHKLLPAWIRGQKKAARQVLAGVIIALGQQASTPEGIRIIVAYGRIATSVKRVREVMSGPDPSPDEVADFIERLVQRVKP